MNGRNRPDGPLIERALIDDLLHRRVDPLPHLEEDASWSHRYGIQPGSLRRVRENLGFAADPGLAATAGFRLGIELPDPASLPQKDETPSSESHGVEFDGRPATASQLDFQIAVCMGGLFAGSQLVAPIDGPWCHRHAVSIEAADSATDICGRFVRPETAAGSAFELAIEARSAVQRWRTET